MLRTAIIFSGTACLLAVPTKAIASDQSTKISASVAEVCRFEAAPLLVDQESGIATGQAFESCNSSRSYAITANTRSLSGNEAVILRYGQTPISLDADGSTVVKRSHGPTFRISDLKLEVDDLDQPLTVTLAMVAV